jgi:hypothetical protein
LIRSWQEQTTHVQRLRLFTIDELIRLTNLSGRFRTRASHRYTGWHSPNSVDKYYCQNLNGRNANAKSQIHI